MAKKEAEVEFAHVSSREVFEPSDWLGHFFVPVRGAETGAARQVERKNREWRLVGEPLHTEFSFFPPEEPVRIVGHYKRS